MENKRFNLGFARYVGVEQQVKTSAHEPRAVEVFARVAEAVTTPGAGDHTSITEFDARTYEPHDYGVLTHEAAPTIMRDIQGNLLPKATIQKDLQRSVKEILQELKHYQ